MIGMLTTALSSFGQTTGQSSGGGFPMSASSGVSGDDGGDFGDFNYKTGANNNSKDYFVIGAIVLVALLALKKK